MDSLCSLSFGCVITGQCLLQNPPCSRTRTCQSGSLSSLSITCTCCTLLSIRVTAQITRCQTCHSFSPRNGKIQLYGKQSRQTSNHTNTTRPTDDRDKDPSHCTRTLSQMCIM